MAAHLEARAAPGTRDTLEGDDQLSAFPPWPGEAQPVGVTAVRSDEECAPPADARPGSGDPVDGAACSLRELHGRARRSRLAPDELATYSAAVERFVRGVLASQNMTLLPNQTRRRVPRVCRSVQVELQSPRGAQRTITLDLGTGGFSALLASVPPPEELLTASLCLRRGTCVTGVVRVVGVRSRGRAARLSFAFERLPQPELERLESFIVDELLSRFTMRP